MDIFDFLSMLGGLCLFLFGMTLMGEALERRAGSKLESMLGKMTTGKLAGFLTGLGVTSIIQSSSATTVMVVGFVNSGLMNLSQAINVIMGANVGTTVTAWILSLGGISGDNIFVRLLKPTSFTPLLALVGIALYMFTKNNKKRDTGTVLLGFATLMFGMNIMTESVSGLADIPEFQSLFLMFENPILGVVVGAVLTAIVQSSSASVGILQALSATGQVSLGAAVPIIMGQNIGTCVTALISSVGANKNARRAAVVHLSFNVIGTLICLSLFSVIDLIFSPVLFDMAADHMSIAVAHSLFNIVCTAILLPASSLLARIASKIIPDGKATEEVAALDERLLEAPAIALERCGAMLADMSESANIAIREAMLSLTEYSTERATLIREKEERCDKYEDVIGTYLVKLGTRQLDDAASSSVTQYMKVIGDLERISDHAVNVLESAEELREKGIAFTPDASAEMAALCEAVGEITEKTARAFAESDTNAAMQVEPLEEVIDRMKERMRTNHILRLSDGKCSIEAGFVWADLLTNLERISDHCSNIAGGVMDAAVGNMDIHSSLRSIRSGNDEFDETYSAYLRKYLGKR